MNILKNVFRFISKSFLYALAAIIIIISGIYVFREDIREHKIEEFNALSEGVYDYEIDGYHFKVPGAYLSPVRRFRSGKTRALWLEGQMPDLSPRISDPDYRVNNTDPDRITFEIFTRRSHAPLTEYVPVNYDVNTRQVMENDWVSYKSDMGYLYYKNLNKPNASRMRCDSFDRGSNPGCHVKFNLNNKLEVIVNFRISSRMDWENIEDKVRLKLNEFYISEAIK